MMEHWIAELKFVFPISIYQSYLIPNEPPKRPSIIGHLFNFQIIKSYSKSTFFWTAGIDAGTNHRIVEQMK